ncbi:phage protein NinX family protein [Enterobacter hormaechei]|uniref:phage protein NinX family protein n=1 Tax=Enterobacter hormaechei TaxID=158836 RepID=UPI0007995821|nr:phage protein NinX family protein [Enterobacter hormaechei]CZY58937.1 Protein of uncharacterised function (DUF2591) [Enterobacter hormaechei]CZY63277.1 Protein of uncharacterised function (DUF2591) [Enterobacter hormaechei]CZY72896.1 Protein of uncharacterised function (DUF2591) [Enterobacter hormaechei]SAF36569.1 Protein of uncharacterised function (DUF2591) [Enterobacter hormaechei]
MDYSQLSDFEINKCVSVAAGLNVNMSFDVDEAYARGPVWTAPSGNFYAGIKSSKGNPFDPCNNPADAWPIIESSNISINHDAVVEEWIASHGGVIYQHCRGKRPLRLAMECFLKMQDANHA